MLEYKGKYGNATVMIDSIDEETVSQIYGFLNNEVFINPIAIMPDTHAGKGSVIGFTMKMSDKIIPNIVGVDINCGMLFFTVGKNILAEMKRSEIDERIREAVPFGTSVHKKSERIMDAFWLAVNLKHLLFVKKFNQRYGTSYPNQNFDMNWFGEKCEQIGMDYTRAIQSVGTLGGGNHFIELGKSAETKEYGFTIHSGSRQFGLKICNYWQRKAGKGHLAALSGDDMFGYLSDMVVAQVYAELNRFKMKQAIVKACNLDPQSCQVEIQTNHNFIDFDDFIIRKGAIRSYIGEKMIIPFNMEDGILICEGKSNPQWNFSAPHGAGRIDSRKWAKNNLNLNEAEQRMKKKDIYASKLPKDELKGAYKDPKIIEAAIEPTAKIVDRLTPVLAMKDD